MKFVTDRPFADPDAAAHKLMELAHAFEPVQDGRIYIEKINGSFLFQLKGTPAEYKAGSIDLVSDKIVDQLRNDLAVFIEIIGDGRAAFW